MQLDPLTVEGNTVTMQLRVATLLLTLSMPCASPLAAQREPPIDSLVAAFLAERGTAGEWQPHKLFEDCAPLEGWRERGFVLLTAAAESSEMVERELLASWGGALARCGNARLEQWVLGRLDATIRSGQPTLLYWYYLRDADSPAIRAYLMALMLDHSMRGQIRLEASGVYFRRFSGDELLAEFLNEFRLRRLPSDMLFGPAYRLLINQPESFLRGLGVVVRSEPELAGQAAFPGIVAGAQRFASEASRRELADQLRKGMLESGDRISGDSRYNLEWLVTQLERSEPLR